MWSKQEHSVLTSQEVSVTRCTRSVFSRTRWRATNSLLLPLPAPLPWSEACTHPFAHPGGEPTSHMLRSKATISSESRPGPCGPFGLLQPDTMSPWLINNADLFFTVLEAGSLSSWCQHGWDPVKSLFWVADGFLSALPFRGGGRRGELSFLVTRCQDAKSIMGILPNDLIES